MNSLLQRKCRNWVFMDKWSSIQHSAISF